MAVPEQHRTLTHGFMDIGYSLLNTFTLNYSDYLKFENMHILHDTNHLFTSLFGCLVVDVSSQPPLQFLAI
jgi:hypothetical protein